MVPLDGEKSLMMNNGFQLPATGAIAALDRGTDRQADRQADRRTGGHKSQFSMSTHDENVQ